MDQATVIAWYQDQASARARDIAQQMVAYWETIRESDMPESIAVCVMSEYQARVLDAVMPVDPTVQALIDASGEYDSD
jgi:hypothetical protein